MSTHSASTHDIPHSPAFDVRYTTAPVDRAAVLQARLNEIARRSPQAVLEVLRHWLEPQSADVLES